MKVFYALFVIFLFAACNRGLTGSGNIISQNRTVSNFSSVDVGGSIKVEIKQGSPASVVVSADDNVLPYLETSVSGDELNIHFKRIHSFSNVTAKVVVTVTDLKEIHASASASVSIKDPMKGNKLIFEASSSAEIIAEVDAPEAEATASSAATIILKGTTKKINAQASSGASVDAKGLKAENAEADASSGARTSVFASLSIDGSASSGGSVNYTGGATKVVKNESSGGSVSGE